MDGSVLLWASESNRQSKSHQRLNRVVANTDSTLKATILPNRPLQAAKALQHRSADAELHDEHGATPVGALFGATDYTTVL
jgi:hypothetical protein